MRILRYISLFSGIGGFDLGFDRAGMQCAMQVEKDKYARAVLERHWKDVLKLEDVRDVTRENAPPVDLICGGFPCQDISVAGNRAGLAGERSGLWFEFIRIISEIKPEWVVIENVPGLLSSSAGRDFAVILHGLVECGYGVVWRILDSQYFGVPQRRRRVYIVGHLGTGCAASVLFESEGVSGDFEASGKTGQRIAGTLSASSPSRRNGGSDPTSGHFIVGTLAASGVGSARPSGQKNETDMLVYQQQGFGLYRKSLKSGSIKSRDYKSPTDIVISIDARNNAVDGRASGTIQANGKQSLNYTNPIAFTHNAGVSAGLSVGDLSPTLRANASKGSTSTAVAQSQGIRRLTPVECERLQGFPDNWTDGQSNSQRYKQLGNAVTVNVAEWIGGRIVEIAG